MFIKQKMRELNARPIKKVLEAKHRKAKRDARKLLKIKDKANQIVQNADLTEKQKGLEINRMYKKARIGKVSNDRKLTYVQARKHKAQRRPQREGAVGKYLMVDKRQRSDKRGKKDAMKRRKAMSKARAKR